VRTYTLKEAAKKINSSPGKIRQWEKDLSGLLVTPRTKQGARIYTDAEIELLLYIKELYSSNLGKEAIQNIFKQKITAAEKVETMEAPQSQPAELFSFDEPDVTVTDGTPQIGPDSFIEALESYRQSIINDVRDAIRQEVVDEIKKEISERTDYAVKTIADTIYNAAAGTTVSIQGLTGRFEKAAEHNADSLKSIHKRISNQTIETSQEFYNIAKQLSESTEEIARYIDLTNNEISHLTEAVEKEREYYVEDFEEIRHEIKQREIAFQDMLLDFREAAAAKSKKWWKIW